MNNYYAKVKLPELSTLFKDISQLCYKEHQVYKIFNNDIFSEAGLAFFNTINVTPSFVVSFMLPHLNNHATVNDRAIHFDITVDKNNNEIPIICGLNFELGLDTVSVMSWFDMKDNSEVWPVTPAQGEVPNWLGGVHYSDRMYCGVPPGAVCIEKIIISEPTLVRTNLPHTVTFDAVKYPRTGVTIRFNETWNSWEECLEMFKPIITNPT